MDSDQSKKYNVIENVLQKINSDLALPEDEIKRNNQLLVIIDRLVEKMRSQSILFKNLYQNKFYGGSFYDGLKIRNPSEYDLDCILCLPKIVEATVEASKNKPGFVNVVINNLKALEKQAGEAPKYVGLEKLLNGNQLSTQKVKSWIESLLNSCIKEMTSIQIPINGTECCVKTNVSKNGPAHTLKLEGTHGDKNFNLDIDFVPCFTFFDEQWPKQGYRKNNSKKKTFFVVPKGPKEENTDCWRLSFQEQERELITGTLTLKPTLKLIKQIRDRYNHKIASYYIKTVFLWELHHVEKSMWQKPLSFVFIMMLKKYAEYIEKKEIPYYWNSKYNLIGDLSDTTASCISNKLKNIASHIDRISTIEDIYAITYFFKAPNGFDIETFKADVPLGKKLLKQLEGTKPQSQENPSLLVEVQNVEADSSSSSFEDICEVISEKVPNETFSPPLPTNLETICLSLVSQQKIMFNMLETIRDKLDNCESQIAQLTQVINNNHEEGMTHVTEMSAMINLMERNVRMNLNDNEPEKKHIDEQIME